MDRKFVIKILFQLSFEAFLSPGLSLVSFVDSPTDCSLRLLLGLQPAFLSAFPP